MVRRWYCWARGGHRSHAGGFLGIVTRDVLNDYRLVYHTSSVVTSICSSLITSRKHTPKTRKYLSIDVPHTVDTPPSHYTVIPLHQNRDHTSPNSTPAVSADSPPLSPCDVSPNYTSPPTVQSHSPAQSHSTHPPHNLPSTSGPRYLSPPGSPCGGS